jgi:hypothetical protein
MVGKFLSLANLKAKQVIDNIEKFQGVSNTCKGIRRLTRQERSMKLFAMLILLICASCTPTGEGVNILPAGAEQSNEPDTQKRVGFLLNSYIGVESYPIGALNLTFNHTTTEYTLLSFDFAGTATAGTSCTAGVDYVPPANNQLLIPSGVSSYALDLKICSDTLPEGTETVIVTILSSDPEMTLSPHASATFFLQDSFTDPTVSFSLASSSVVEGDAGTTTRLIDVELSHASNLPISVVATVSGSATNMTDYTVTGSIAGAITLNFAAGQTSQQIEVLINGDTDVEPDETLILTLSAPTNASLGAQPLHTLTIEDDDAVVVLPTVAFTGASGLMVEGDAGTTTYMIDVALSAASADTVTVTATFTGTATYNTDYSVTDSAAGSIDLTFAPGELNQQIEINIIGDTDVEVDETVIVTLSAPDNADLGGQIVHTLTIQNDDAAAGVPTLSYQAITYQASVDQAYVILPDSIDDQGDPIISCVATPALPTGLVIDGTTCQITGIPEVLADVATYSVVATNGAGSSLAASVIIEVGCPVDFSYVRNGGNDFCVMKFEARCQGVDCPTFVSTTDQIVTSSDLGEPIWVDISIDDATQVCREIGSNYDLISNDEWMGIAREIETIDSNWSDGIVGSGSIFQGNIGVDSPPISYSLGSLDSNAEAGRNPNARLELESGDHIWDISGNAHEWVAWEPGTHVVPGICGHIGELTDIGAISAACPDWLPSMYTVASGYTSAQGTGSLISSSIPNAAIARGGTFVGTPLQTGIYHLNLEFAEGTINNRTGFRCVWRP